MDKSKKKPAEVGQEIDYAKNEYFSVKFIVKKIIPGTQVTFPHLRGMVHIEALPGNRIKSATMCFHTHPDRDSITRPDFQITLEQEGNGTILLLLPFPEIWNLDYVIEVEAVNCESLKPYRVS